MRAIVKRKFQTTANRARSINKKIYNIENETPISAITRNVIQTAHVISRALARPSGITTAVVYIVHYKTRVRSIGADGAVPRYDERDLAGDQNRAYLASFNYHSATLISRVRDRSPSMKLRRLPLPRQSRE